jgi:hypothetical protein
VLQVVSTTKTDTFSQSLGANSQGSSDAISVSITPTSSTSKIFIMFNITATSTYWTNGNSATSVACRLVKNGSSIAIGDAAGNRNRVTAYVGAPGGTATPATTAAQMSMQFLDSPATVSSITYGVRLDNLDNGSQTVYLNRGPSDGDSNVLVGRAASTITVMEIAA